MKIVLIWGAGVLFGMVFMVLLGALFSPPPKRQVVAPSLTIPQKSREEKLLLDIRDTLDKQEYREKYK